MPQTDPRWIGAWWLGFVVFGPVIFVPALMLFFFPSKTLRIPNRLAADSNNRADGEPESDKTLALVDKHKSHGSKDEKTIDKLKR